MEFVVAARVLHVLAVVVWIGGVSMVTTVVLPGVRRGDFGLDRLRAFRAVEHRFVWIARGAVIIVGASGLYMVWEGNFWDRFQSAEFWWMHAMVCLWLLFAIILFVVEPLILHKRIEAWTLKEPERAFARLQTMHWVLLVLSLITVAGAVAGSHGCSIF